MADLLVSTEPATGAHLWEAPIGVAATEVAAARAAARAAAGEWAACNLDDRIAVLRAYADLVRARADVMADLIARETGKPLWEARTEVDAVANKVGIAITAQAERAGSRDLGGGGALRHRPHGVLAVLGPFNFPAHLPNGHIVPALLAGNAVVFKPSEKTPATGAMLIDLLREAGVPAGCARLLIGGPDEGRALAADPGIDGLLFTGSARGGAALHRQFAETPHKILALELGGNNPLLVWDTPSIEAAATIAVQSAYMTAGQRCTAARRLIVQDGAASPLADAIAALVDRILIGAPHDDPAPFIGPVIDNDAADGVLRGYDALVAKGGRVIRPLARPIEGRPFLTPGLIDVTDVAGRADEELFGPLIQMVRVSDFDTALAEAGNTRFGLSASLVSDRADLYDRFRSTIRAGIVNWNRPTNGASSAAPFGGVGLSGNHRPSAYYAADYCAYPVASSEAPAADASIAVGLRTA